MTPKEIKSLLPYQDPFLFVDSIESVDENSIQGSYAFKPNEYFYQGHFKNQPITPGVILTEVMAQIGVVCLGIYLFRGEISNGAFPQIALVSSAVDFYLPVLPGEKVQVKSEKEYFRFNKLKCVVQLFNEKDQLVCRGTIAGMVK